MSEWQTRVLNRTLDGFKGKLGNAKWAALGNRTVKSVNRVVATHIHRDDLLVWNQ